MSGDSQRVAFVGGRVWTAGFSGSRRLDVLVEGSRIVDVARAGDLDTQSADRHDITGRLLIPGFQDAHLHPGDGGRDLLGCNLAGLETREAVYAAIADYADRNPDLPWVIGGGWYREIFPNGSPTRQELDELVGARPAFISPYDRHGAWVSTAALEAAGVDASSPDPLDGTFTRDADGGPAGMAEEGAIAIIRAVMPEQSTRDRADAILRAQSYLLPLGVTSVQDALVGTGLGLLDHLDAYAELLRGDELKLRVTTALWWDPTKGVEQLAELEARRARLENIAGPDRIVADTVKVMVDGVHVIYLDEDQLRTATIALDRAGFTAHYHSYGDATTRWVLNAIEAAILENGPRVRRHHIAHLMVVAPDDFARFAELGVTANVQALWGGGGVAHDDLKASTDAVHPESLEYPFARLQAAGAHLAAGSDWPVTTADPIEIARVETARSRPGRGGAEVDELDRLDLLTLLTAYTEGSAFVNGRGSSTGRIAAGFLADLAVVDRDIFAPGALEDAVVDETWVGGKQVFRRG